MSELTAYHEAGHVLMAVLLGARVDLVTIEPDDDDGPRRYGDTQLRWRRKRWSDEEFARRVVQVCLAGPAAEMLYSGDPFHPGLIGEWADDWRQAWQAAIPLFPAEPLRLQYLEQVAVELHRRLNAEDLWSPLAALADNLLAQETLEREQIEDILSEWLDF